MRASDVMTEEVICLDHGASVFDAAELMISVGVSALPVVDGGGKIVGIVSESDLMRLQENGATTGGSWLSRLVADKEAAARESMRSHSRRITEVMTGEVIATTEDAELRELVDLMERHGVKRVPILRERHGWPWSAF